jgi:hypothetical protein
MAVLVDSSAWVHRLDIAHDDVHFDELAKLEA